MSGFFGGGAGGGGTPGGSDTQVQFNDNGAFGGDSGFVFNKTTKKITTGGAIEVGSHAIVGDTQSRLTFGPFNGTFAFHGPGTVAADTFFYLDGGITTRSNYQIRWVASSLTAFGSADTGLGRAAAGIVKITDGSSGNGMLQMGEVTAPSAPAANLVTLFAADVGGKTAVMAQFPTGAAQQIAIEP